MRSDRRLLNARWSSLSLPELDTELQLAGATPMATFDTSFFWLVVDCCLFWLASMIACVPAVSDEPVTVVESGARCLAL